MKRLSTFRGALWLSIAVALAASPNAGAAAEEPVPAGSALDACLSAQGLPRAARVVDPVGRIVYVRVLDAQDGQPIRVAPIARAATPLAEVFRRLAAGDGLDAARAFEITAAERADRICSPVDLTRRELAAADKVIVAAGLNYAAHADEAGGGDVFLFPKPAAPTGPFAPVHAPAGVTLLDYEVELGFVLLEDVGLGAPPDLEALIARSAFFLANDVSDRAPIIEHASFSGPGTGFVEGKGQPGFLPAGPWMVRGSELFAALAACGEDGLGLQLWVDTGSGPALRQSASTALMILDPAEMIAAVGETVRRDGPISPMPMPTERGERFYPLAVGDPEPGLPAGSVLLTGTPEGVALNAPSPLGVGLRALWNWQSPFAQFLEEERTRAAAGEGNYLRPGDRVHARIDGLGAQIFAIGEPGTPAPLDPCRQRAASLHADRGR